MSKQKRHEEVIIIINQGVLDKVVLFRGLIIDKPIRMR